MTLEEIVKETVRELRMMAIIAGQSSGEGDPGARADVERMFADRCTHWADKLEGKHNG